MVCPHLLGKLISNLCPTLFDHPSNLIILLRHHMLHILVLNETGGEFWLYLPFIFLAEDVHNADINPLNPPDSTGMVRFLKSVN